MNSIASADVQSLHYNCLRAQQFIHNEGSSDRILLSYLTERLRRLRQLENDRKVASASFVVHNQKQQQLQQLQQQQQQSEYIHWCEELRHNYHNLMQSDLDYEDSRWQQIRSCEVEVKDSCASFVASLLGSPESAVEDKGNEGAEGVGIVPSRSRKQQLSVGQPLPSASEGMARLASLKHTDTVQLAAEAKCKAAQAQKESEALQQGIERTLDIWGGTLGEYTEALKDELSALKRARGQKRHMSASSGSSVARGSGAADISGSNALASSSSAAPTAASVHAKNKATMEEFRRHTTQHLADFTAEAEASMERVSRRALQGVESRFVACRASNSTLSEMHTVEDVSDDVDGGGEGAVESRGGRFEPLNPSMLLCDGGRALHAYAAGEDIDAAEAGAVGEDLLSPPAVASSTVFRRAKAARNARDGMSGAVAVDGKFVHPAHFRDMLWQLQLQERDLQTSRTHTESLHGELAHDMSGRLTAMQQEVVSTRLKQLKRIQAVCKSRDEN